MKTHVVLVVILVAAALTGAVQAQDGSQVLLPGGYTLLLPDGWEQAETAGLYTFAHDSTLLILVLPDALDARIDRPADADAADVLIEAYAALADQPLDKETDLQTQDSGERSLVTYEFETEDGSVRGISAVLEVTPGQFTLMEFRAPADDYESALPDVLAIMQSLEMRAATGVNAEPCRVSAADAYVDLRVGPGPNRGVYTGMTTGLAYGVLGQKTLADGSLWWRLDTNTGSANELWVADADVVTSGGCDLVADVDAPPVIFGAPSAPPAASDTPGAAPAVANPSKIPANGRWNFAVASEFLVSCEGGETEHIPTAALGFTPFVATIYASPNGTTLTLSDPSETLTFYGVDGYYQYGETVTDFYLAWHLYVASPTQMGSDVTVTLISAPCSGTIPISVRYLG